MRLRITRASRSSSSLRRVLVSRSMNPFPRLNGATTAFLLNTIAARGRVSRAMNRPAASDWYNTPTSASNVTIMLDAMPCGAMCPYPIVANVCTLKKKLRVKLPPGISRPGPVRLPSPLSTNRTAKSMLSARYASVSTTAKRGQLTVSAW